MNDLNCIFYEDKEQDLLIYVNLRILYSIEIF